MLFLKESILLSHFSTMKQYKSLELQAHVSIDDVINKVTQEVWELSDALALWDEKEVIWEVQDALINILSVAKHFNIAPVFSPSQEMFSVQNLMTQLSLWNQKVQSLRGRYMRESATPEELLQVTNTLISQILWASPIPLDEKQVVERGVEKFSQRVEKYLPQIDVKDYIAEFPDFPKQGIQFKDVSPLLRSPEALRYVTFELAKMCQNAEVIVWLDARGFLFGVLVAELLQKPFTMIRKKGKLPWETESVSYGLEYGKDTIELQKDAFLPGQKVSIIDDLLATGGTALAAAQLVEKLWGVVENIACVVSLDDEFLQSQAPRKSLTEKYRLSWVTSYN